MPNWCMNNLRVSGDSKKSLTSFRDWLGSDGFKLNKIDPLPKELDGTIAPNPAPDSNAAKALLEKFGVDNWYDWQVANWGTKWDVDAEVDDQDSLIFINFDSAWSPPCAAIGKLGKLFPDLEFTLTYQEGGMCFAGRLDVNGDDVEDFCIDGGKDKEAYQQFCLDEFDFDPFEGEEDES